MILFTLLWCLSLSYRACRGPDCQGPDCRGPGCRGGPDQAPQNHTNKKGRQPDWVHRDTRHRRRQTGSADDAVPQSQLDLNKLLNEARAMVAGGNAPS